MTKRERLYRKAVACRVWAEKENAPRGHMKAFLDFEEKALRAWQTEQLNDAITRAPKQTGQLTFADVQRAYKANPK